MNIHSSAAACWICLEGGPDEKGEPIIRDCACRGSDAGFAHTSCIIQYAKKKCEDAIDSDEFDIPWEKCPNCNQHYQNDLAVNLSDAFVSHAKKTYGYSGNDLTDKSKVMDALRLQIQSRRRCRSMTMGGKSAIDAVKVLVHELLAMVEHAKKEHGMDEWVHMAPDSFQFQHYAFICLSFEAYGYETLGTLEMIDMSKENTMTEISYYEKALDICKSVNNIPRAKLMTDRINTARSKIRGGVKDHLKLSKKNYRRSCDMFGENSDQALSTAMAYSVCLRDANHSIEAERLLTKLAANCRQVYGEDHVHTKDAVTLWTMIKRRLVQMISLESPDGKLLPLQAQRFEAKRYENDGKICIVAGPITDLNQDKYDDGHLFPVASELIYPGIGCPVICHGLKNAPHLNGKLGDVRSVANDGRGGIRFGVYFEDASLKSAAVKRENLSIVFDLPSA